MQQQQNWMNTKNNQDRMDDLLYQAANLTTNGASQLANGNERIALRLFHSALNAISVSQENPRCDHNSSITTQHSRVAPSFAVVPVTMRDSEKLFEPNCLYSNALVVHHTPQVSPALFSTRSAAAILFNMSLAYVKRGRRRDDRALIQRAVSFLEMAVNLCVDMDDECPYELLVPVLNNKACAAYESGDLDGARETIFQLQTILNTTTVRPPGFDDGSFASFLLIFMGDNIQRHAPAA